MVSIIVIYYSDIIIKKIDSDIMIKKILYFVSILIIIILTINILIIIIIHGFEYIKCHNIQLNLNSIPKLYEILVCYSPDKNKRHVFFYTCPYALLVNIS